MVKLEWGLKRACVACQAHFYDLWKSPYVCPECGQISETFQQTRGKRGRPSGKSVLSAVVNEVVEADILAHEPHHEIDLLEDIDKEMDKDMDKELDEHFEEDHSSKDL